LLHDSQFIFLQINGFSNNRSDEQQDNPGTAIPAGMNFNTLPQNHRTTEIFSFQSLSGILSLRKSLFPFRKPSSAYFVIFACSLLSE